MRPCDVLRQFSSGTPLAEWLAAIAFLSGLTAWSLEASGQTITPDTHFTAREISGLNVLVGAPAGSEGTPWKSNFLSVKEATSDRVIFEYSLVNREPASQVLLDFEFYNLDEPNWTLMSLYAFNGNGLANAADYYRLDDLLTTFTDDGTGAGALHLDVTQTYNSFITQGRQYLGFLIKNTIGSGVGYSRYDITVPELSIVPEPSALILGFFTLLTSLSMRTGRFR